MSAEWRYLNEVIRIASSNVEGIEELKNCKVTFSLVFYRTAPIHAEAPEFTDMSVEQEILVTGIKVVDLLAPYAKGGKIGKC